MVSRRSFVCCTAAGFSLAVLNAHRLSAQQADRDPTQDAAQERRIALPQRAPADVDMRAAELVRIDELVAAGLVEKKMPGCVVCIGRRGSIVWRKAYGLKQLQPDEQPMTVDTVFDLASLTKPIATGTSVLLLAERGKVKIEEPVATYLPEFAANDKGAITVCDLLTHQSGLIADNALADYEQGPEEALRRVMALKLVAPTRSKFIYSDVNFIVLGELVRRVTGRTLHEFTRDELFRPLQLRETSFVPDEPLRRRAAPTQKRGDDWLRGVVHDPRAARLDGVAGHAGLFSTADDLAVFAQMLLDGGRRGEQRLLAPETIVTMTRAYPIPGGGIRGLGWDKRTGFSNNRGEGMSDAAFGHGGFTGTAIWIDPQLEMFVIFLSNRVHPDGKGNVNALAGKIGGVAVAATRAESRP